MRSESLLIIRLLFIFVGVFVVMQVGWEHCRNTELERRVIDEATVKPAAWTIQRLWPGDGVIAAGHTLQSTHRRLNILNGCEGLETLFLLIAGLAAYPLQWRRRLAGLLFGTVLIYTINQSRIVILWWASKTDPALFGALHGFVMPVVLLAATFGLFLTILPRHTQANSWMAQ